MRGALWRVTDLKWRLSKANDHIVKLEKRLEQIKRICVDARLEPTAVLPETLEVIWALCHETTLPTENDNE